MVNGVNRKAPSPVAPPRRSPYPSPWEGGTCRLSGRVSDHVPSIGRCGHGTRSRRVRVEQLRSIEIFPKRAGARNRPFRIRAAGRRRQDLDRTILPHALRAPAAGAQGFDVTFTMAGFQPSVQKVEVFAVGDGTTRLRPNPVLAELTPMAPPPKKKFMRKRHVTHGHKAAVRHKAAVKRTLKRPAKPPMREQAPAAAAPPPPQHAARSRRPRLGRPRRRRRGSNKAALKLSAAAAQKAKKRDACAHVRAGGRHGQYPPL